MPDVIDCALKPWVAANVGELRRIALTRGWPIHELRTRRRALLIGIPAGLGGAGVFWSGIAIGALLERRRAERSRRLRWRWRR